MSIFTLLLNTGARTRDDALTLRAYRRPLLPAPYLYRFVVLCIICLMPFVLGISFNQIAVAKAHTLPASSVVSRQGFVDPIAVSPFPSRVLRGFNNPEKPWMPGHRGVDLAATVGSPVHAAGSGTVHFVGVIFGIPTISIAHPQGFRTTYQPVSSTLVVGDAVIVGQRIGTLSAAPRLDPGLQWGAKYDDDTYINPLGLLDTPVIRLKPWKNP